MEYEIDYKQKLEDLIKEAKNANFYMIMLMARINGALEEILKASESAGDDPIAQAFLYESIRPSLEEMIDRIKQISEELKL